MNEDLESSVLDYMLYYVLVRSESAELMQYNLLIELLDSLIQTQSRAASAQRKNRPESSSPEKLKLRNPQPAKKASDEIKVIKAQDEDSEDDDYSDEEIANDPDEGEDGTNKLMNVKDLVDEQDDDDDEDQYLEEFTKVQKTAAAQQEQEKDSDEDDVKEDYGDDEDRFEESPRQKVAQDQQDQDDEEDQYKDD